MRRANDQANHLVIASAAWQSPPIQVAGFVYRRIASSPPHASRAASRNDKSGLSALFHCTLSKKTNGQTRPRLSCCNIVKHLLHKVCRLPAACRRFFAVAANDNRLKKWQDDQLLKLKWLMQTFGSLKRWKRVSREVTLPGRA